MLAANFRLVGPLFSVRPALISMEILVVSCVSLIAAGLTLFSGFGLGTVLTPAFALFFPVATAVAMTAVVHLANNLFKTVLIGRHAHWSTVLRFGLPAALAATVGAGMLSYVSGLAPLFTYNIQEDVHAITPVKAFIGSVIVVFAMLEFSPAFARWTVPSRWLPLGGLLAGFFGGLSGNQGALRSAFLIRVGLTKESYVGTGAVCAMMVDVARIATYAMAFPYFWLITPLSEANSAVLAATVCAFVGTYFGAKILKKVTLRFVELTVAVLMIAIGLCLVSGLL